MVLCNVYPFENLWSYENDTCEKQWKMKYSCCISKCLDLHYYIIVFSSRKYDGQMYKNEKKDDSIVSNRRRKKVSRKDKSELPVLSDSSFVLPVTYCE